ncbi:MAG: zinc ribbon domain-containing protein [Lachnospiraceae bacterium]|nr:zinc ribbon domain-containing protein [Lachnospiraceae bacterium]
MKECSFCGAEIKDETKPCPGCGYNPNLSCEIYGDAKEIDSQIIEENHQQNTFDVRHKVLPTWLKVVLVVITVFVSPIVGIIVGSLLLFNESYGYRSFGKKLIIITVLYIAVTIGLGLIVPMAVIFGSFMH